MSPNKSSKGTNIEKFKPVPFGKTSTILTSSEIKILWRYCSRRDVEYGLGKYPPEECIFDVRSGAINVWSCSWKDETSKLNSYIRHTLMIERIGKDKYRVYFLRGCKEICPNGREFGYCYMCEDYYECFKESEKDIARFWNEVYSKAVREAEKEGFLPDYYFCTLCNKLLNVNSEPLLVHLREVHNVNPVGIVLTTDKISIVDVRGVVYEFDLDKRRLFIKKR